MFDNKIYVYDERMRRIAAFDNNTEGLSEEGMRNLMVAPTVHIEQNGVSSFSFQMLADCEKWQEIKDPRNIYEVNDRYYTALNDGAYSQNDDNGVPIINVNLLETWSLLSKKFTQVYNCGIYTYAKAKFVGYERDGARFTISASDCLNPGETISSAKAWEQVKAWTPKDEKGNQLTFSILTSDKYKATNWKDVPTGVFMKSFTVSGNTATAIIQSRTKSKVGQVFQYNSSGSYKIDVKPLPTSIESVVVNYTTVSVSSNKDSATYTTSEKTVTNYSYNSSTGVLTLRYYPSSNETVNGITVVYFDSDLGEISPGATCTFAYGAEAIDEHTFVVLPKANKKYKLTIDGVSYEDSEVKDSRGIVMPRGSGGYAMWAALKNSGWTLGICDVIAKDFDASIDYGCFNIEADMKDVLYIVQYIQQLYGGILQWDSVHKILNYRAENSTDYQAANDDFNKWKGYVFREGKNLTERPNIVYDNSIITRAYLLGYGNLNVKAVNDGKSYIEDFSYSEEVYSGYLEQPLIYDTRDEGGQRQLLYWGQKELKKKCRPRKNVSLSAQDLRTVEGLEHEIFDINEVVRVYYHNGITNVDEHEDMRVTMWEYNVFAMWDCTIELGDRVQNLTELFKLIYKNTLQPPGSNASGDISSNKVHISQIGFGGDGDGWFGYGDSDSLTRHIELIAQTTTETSNAVAGLILDTDAMHAQVDLFALYQKQTDKLFTETYAGLTFYADEQSAQAELNANHHTDTTVENAKGELEGKISTTAAGLRAYADEIGAKFETWTKGEWTTFKNGYEAYKKEAETKFLQSVSEDEAFMEGYVKFKTEEMGKAISSAISSFELKANDKYAKASLQAEFNSFKNGIKETISRAGFVTMADVDEAYAGQIAQIGRDVAAVETIVGPEGGKITAKVQNDFTRYGISIEQDNVYVNARYFNIDSTQTNFLSAVYVSGMFYVENHNNFFLGRDRVYKSRIWLTDGDGESRNFDILTFGP